VKGGDSIKTLAPSESEKFEGKILCILRRNHAAKSTQSEFSFTLAVSLSLCHHIPISLSLSRFSLVGVTVFQLSPPMWVCQFCQLVCVVGGSCHCANRISALQTIAKAPKWLQNMTF